MNNPQAFPQVLTVQDRNGLRQPEEASLTGMTLRDYFAAKVLEGYRGLNLASGEPTWERVAEQAYIAADAMLKAREQ